MTGFLRLLARAGLVAGLMSLLLRVTACAPVGSALNNPMLNDITSNITESLQAEAEGRIEEAIGLARSATKDSRVQTFPVMRATALQRLGLALTSAGRLEEAEAVAREMDTLNTNVRGMPVHSAIAFARCDFSEAANLQLRMRSASSAGVNDRATEVNLAAIDEAEGRFLRALERLEHVANAPPNPRSGSDFNALMASEVQVATARIRSRLGEHAGLAKVMDDLKRPDPVVVAHRYAEHALKSHKSLYRAYNMLVDGLLLAEDRSAPEETVQSSQQDLRKVLDTYRDTPSPCRKVVPDPTIMEAPANRAKLFPWQDSSREADATADEKANRQATGYLAGREIHLNQQIPFDYNSAEIKPDGSALLDWLATFLTKHPELGTVSIEGHTDDQGSPQYNLDLSIRRAKSVVAALTTRGVPSARLVAKGYGQTQPKIIGTDEAARAANRRVEILVSGVALQSTAEESKPQ
jgi:outer membrane protein OmpA-like peptidoglycan-associated protein